MNPDEAVLLRVDEYSRMAEAYEAHVVPRFAPLAGWLVAGANLRPNAMVLDVSTGTGLAALLAAKAMGGTGLVVGIDLADGALAVAQTNAARAGLRNLRFELLDSRNIVYRQMAFDAALCSFGLPSIGQEQVLREVCRVLKEGATFHLLDWAPRDAPSGWDAFEEVLAAHATRTPSKTLAELREAADLVAKFGDAAGVRSPDAVVAKMRNAGFSNVLRESHAAWADFPGMDDLAAFHASFGWKEREFAEMGDAGRAAFHQALDERFRECRRGDAIRLRWSVVRYFATK